MLYGNHPAFDIIGIGIGPFNLGLAAMAAGTSLKILFFEKRPRFEWHPGLLLPGARMQVPFYADLVTGHDPGSPYTYLSYLKATGQLYRHGVLENHYPLRSEYLAYGRWVAGQLPSLRFGMECVAVDYLPEERLYRVSVRERGGSGVRGYFTRRLVVGTGTPPCYPAGLGAAPDERVFHSSAYLFHREGLASLKTILVVGSGQSAAEIVLDLLDHTGSDTLIHWHTRSSRLFPMEEGPFAYSLAGPGYIDWFYGLPVAAKKSLLSSQAPLYKGINAGLLKKLYHRMDGLEQAGLRRLSIVAGSTLVSLDQAGRGLYQAGFRDLAGKESVRIAEAVVLGTGYRYRIPDCLDGVRGMFRLDENGCPVLGRDYSADEGRTLFFQNADLYSHGFNSADLGLGPERNERILGVVMGVQ